jgi:predicted membrane protein
MGKLFLIVLAVIAAFMVLSAVISALHFIFWVAVVALIVVVGLRLTGGARRSSRQ